MRSLQIFLQQNSHLKRFNWHFNSTVDETDIAECIQIIIENALNLENLFLKFFGCFPLESIYDNLVTLCKRKNLKSLKLVINRQILEKNVNKLTILGSLGAQINPM